MAIRTMTTREDFETNPEGVEVVHDYPGHEAGLLRHGPKCPHAGKHRDLGPAPHADCVTEGTYGERCDGPFDCLYMRTTHKGKVIALREMNGYDDSDFYALVEEAPGEYREIEYASTRGWTYPNGAGVDATPDVLERYAAHCEARRKAELERRAAAEAKVPRPGRRVKVVRGRKVPIGTEGEVFWYGEDRFARRYESRYAPLLDDGIRGRRIGLRDATGTVHWTSAANVEVVAAEGA